MQSPQKGCCCTAYTCCCVIRAQFQTYKRLITIKHLPLEQEGHIEIIKDQLPPGVNLRVTSTRPLAVPLPNATEVPEVKEGTPLPIDDSNIPLRK